VTVTSQQKEHTMKVVVVRKTQHSRPIMCPWLIDFPTEPPQGKEK
jgi:hypothetical protein